MMQVHYAREVSTGSLLFLGLLVFAFAFAFAFCFASFSFSFFNFNFALIIELESELSLEMLLAKRAVKKKGTPWTNIPPNKSKLKHSTLFLHAQQNYAKLTNSNAEMPPWALLRCNQTHCSIDCQGRLCSDLWFPSTVFGFQENTHWKRPSQARVFPQNLSHNI